MKAACVFCGQPPDKKNKEHIFPQWLLKMTDFHGKNASVGTSWETGKELVFNANSYTFPACTKCNERFGKIEASVKPIVESLLSDQDVTCEELELLLDWFDKVRICAWLGVKYMNQSTFIMTPKYYVNSRVGLKDRALWVTNTYRPEKTLNWSGVNSPAFMFSPTAFTLRVNNLVLVNCSSDLVLSKKLGFPYVQFERPNPNSHKTDMMLAPARNNHRPTLFSTKLYLPSVCIAQPIYKETRKLRPAYYESEYIKKHSYDHDVGIGKIFVIRGGTIASLEKGESVNFAMPEARSIYGPVEVVRPILELQIEMINERKKDLSLLSEEQRRTEIDGTQGIINYLREQIRQYPY